MRVIVATAVASLTWTACAMAYEQEDIQGLWECSTIEGSVKTLGRVEYYTDGALNAVLEVTNGSGETALVTQLDYQGDWRFDNDILFETLTWVRVRAVLQGDQPVVGQLHKQIEDQYQSLIGTRSSSSVLALDSLTMSLEDRLYDTRSECERLDF